MKPRQSLRGHRKQVHPADKKSRWEAIIEEAEGQGKVNEFLAGLEDKARNLTFPSPPGGSVVRTDVDHLCLALRAVVGEYVERGRR